MYAINQQVIKQFRDVTNVTSRVIMAKTAINVSQDLKRKTKIKQVKRVKTIRKKRSALFSLRAPSIGKVGILIREPPCTLRTIKIGCQ